MACRSACFHQLTPVMRTRRFFPLFLDLEGAPVLVVGGGPVATRKVRLLLKFGGRPRVVARELNGELSRLAQQGQVEHVADDYARGQSEGCRLVIAATDDGPLNRRVADDAVAANLPCNVVDDLGASGFITPAIIERLPVTVA